MRSIKFSQSELDFLKSHYEQELNEVEKYAEEIKGMLKKLGAKSAPAASEKPEKKKTGRRGRPRKVVAEPVVAPAAKKEKVKKPAKRTVKKTAVKNAKKSGKKPAPKPAEAPATAAPVTE